MSSLKTSTTMAALFAFVPGLLLTPLLGLLGFSEVGPVAGEYLTCLPSPLTAWTDYGLRKLGCMVSGDVGSTLAVQTVSRCCDGWVRRNDLERWDLGSGRSGRCRWLGARMVSLKSQEE